MVILFGILLQMNSGVLIQCLLLKLEHFKRKENIEKLFLQVLAEIMSDTFLLEIFFSYFLLFSFLLPMFFCADIYLFF